MAKYVAILLQKLRKKNSGKECNEVSDQKGMQCKKLRAQAYFALPCFVQM